MPPLVTMGSLCMCTFGVAPWSVVVTSQTKAMANNMLIATINDKPLPSAFGTCMGNLWTWKPYPPMPPCAPAVTWMPGCTVTKVNNVPALNLTCKGMCSAGGGVISIVNTPAMTIDAK